MDKKLAFFLSSPSAQLKPYQNRLMIEIGHGEERGRGRIGHRSGRGSRMSSTEDAVSCVLATAHPKLRERCSATKIITVLEGFGAYPYDADTLDSS